MESYNIPQITSEKKTQKEMKNQCNLWWFAESVVAESAKLRDRWLMFINTPSLSRTRQLPNQVILIYKYPGKPPKKNLAKTPRHILFFFDILPLFIFFSLSFPFYIRDDQSPKNSDGSTKELTINFPMITYWVVRATSLYHIKKWTSYPLYMALSYNPYGLCISFVNPKFRINTCQSLPLSLGHHCF